VKTVTMGARDCLTRERKGQTFLLIILVIIGIGAMLLLLLLPTTVSIREAEKRLTCLNNLKKIGQALQLYMADYDGCLPFEKNSSNLLWDGGRKEKVNLGRLYPGYLKQPQLTWYCPAQRYYREGHPDFGFAAFASPGQKAYSSYLVRGGLQFDQNLLPDSPLRPALYPEKIAWVSDYNVVGSEICAHKGRGVFVLTSDGSVHFASGSFTCTSSTDPYGQQFWQTMDRRFAEKVKLSSHGLAETSPGLETNPETSASHPVSP